jgi:hypothetical protein
MNTIRPCAWTAAAFAVASMLALPSAAGADVYVVRPRPVVVAPPPPPPPPGVVYVAPAPVAPVCGTRTVRVLVNGVYVYRVVPTC